ncbi:MAG: flavin reductase [Dehalococcoidia bacterium]
MDQDAKKTALRMIPYGIYVLTAEAKNDSVAAATVSCAPAWVECKLTETIEIGDHSIFVGEAMEAGVRQDLGEGRADEATLWMKDLGEKVFYGG